MLARRTFVAAAAAVAVMRPINADAAPLTRLVLIHGRSQGGFDPVELKTAWMDALSGQLALKQLSIPKDVVIEFPYYGDVLDEFVRQSKLPVASEIKSRGGDQQDEFLAFQAQVANELAENAGVTDAQINAEYGDNPKARGPLNWEWVQAIIRAIDKNAGGVSASAIERFTRDVYIYLMSSAVREGIDKIVEDKFNDDSTVVVGHSLGSVIAYNVLKKRRRNVRLLLTVGSPLGIRAVRTPLTPIGFPLGVNDWFNAYDPRDVVALNPLDAAHFAVNPAVKNYSGVKNSTPNRHGISGYLGDPQVAQTLYNALS